MDKIKVVITDPSIHFCQRLSNIVEDEEIIVVGMTQDIDALLELIHSKKPQVVLLDASYLLTHEDQIVNGLMQVNDVSIVILSDKTVHHRAKTVSAISNGAIDFIMKDSDIESQKQQMIAKIKQIYPMKRHRSNFPKRMTARPCSFNKKMSNEHKRESPALIAIGTSTGGPRALQTVLKTFPKNFPVPIVIVQHMPSGFTKSLADRLHNVCKIDVKEAENGEKLKGGTAYIAPGNYHMKVKRKYGDLQVVISQEAERTGHRPSVNTLLESIAPIRELQKIIVILTGMGKDGADGIKRIKQLDKEAVVIVESKESAVIYGMPGAAIETNCVTEIISLEHIGDALMNYVKMRRI